jgi:hypothetical protein
MRYRVVTLVHMRQPGRSVKWNRLLNESSCSLAVMTERWSCDTGISKGECSALSRRRTHSRVPRPCVPLTLARSMSMCKTQRNLRSNCKSDQAELADVNMQTFMFGSISFITADANTFPECAERGSRNMKPETNWAWDV